MKAQMLEAAACTDIGPRTVNQDCLYANISALTHVTYGLFCVADGMGGLNDGHFAASVAVNFVEQWWYEHLSVIIHKEINDRLISDELFELFNKINNTILYRSQSLNIKAGTTCSLLLIINNKFYIAHSGDSRIYKVKRKTFTKNTIQLLTEDHTWGAHQRKERVLSEDEIYASPNKDKLISCLGGYERPQIYIASGNIDSSAMFVISSDGLYKTITETELAKLVLRKKSCEKLANSLIKTAVSRNTNDNSSIVVIRYIKQAMLQTNKLLLFETCNDENTETFQ